MALSKEERRFLEQEYIRCSEDMCYMAKNYCDIQTLRHGKIKMNLYPFQVTALRIIQKNPKIIINKSRQLGVSTLMAVYAIHSLLFRDGYKVAIFANKQKTAQEVLEKIKLIYNGLPTWLKGKELPLVDNKTELRLPNGSIVKAYSSSSDEGRSGSYNIVIVDEGAYIANLESLYASIYPTISSGGSIVMLSSPSSASGFFYEHWINAEAGKNGFIPIKLKWDVHPDRDIKWRENQNQELGIKLAKQEYDCEFGTGTQMVFDVTEISYYENNTVRKPLYTSGELHEFWYWTEPDYSKNYMVIVDSARGDGNDNSTIQIIDLENFEQVGEYEGQLDPKSLAIKSKSVAIEWNNAILVIENNGIGESTAMDVDALGYENLYKTNKSSDYHNSNQFINTFSFDDNLKTGFSMTTNTRPKVISKFQDAIIRQTLIIRSSRTVSELKSFVWLNGKPQASRGSHDDLIMPLGIACYH